MLALGGVSASPPLRNLSVTLKQGREAQEIINRERKRSREGILEELFSNGVGKKSMGKENRDYSRVEVSWPASILSVQGSIDGQVRNISLAGALILLGELPDLTRPLELVIEIPEHNCSLLATAEMVRLDVYDGDNRGPVYALGVRFLDIPEEDLRFLSKTILP